MASLAADVGDMPSAVQAWTTVASSGIALSSSTKWRARARASIANHNHSPLSFSIPAANGDARGPSPVASISDAGQVMVV